CCSGWGSTCAAAVEESANRETRARRHFIWVAYCVRDKPDTSKIPMKSSGISEVS
ncbi:MAG: hypothetical protein ACI9KE_006279, partial [Polyangiales bacterium]